MAFNCESSSSIFEPSLCVICCEFGDDELSIVRTKKGYDSLMNSCKDRNCSRLAKYLSSSPSIVHVHKECRKRFTDLRAVGKRVSETNIFPSKKLRSSSSSFEWKTMCFLCKQPVHDRIGVVEEMREACTLELHGKIMAYCDERNDEWASDVRGRLNMCNDLVSEEAVYHVYCYGRFKRGDKLNAVGGNAGRPESTIKKESFHLMCDWLEVTCDNLYSLDELQQQMTVLAKTAREENNLPAIADCELVYNVKHLKRKLMKRYGSHIVFSEVCGKPNVVCFRDMCSYLISDKWYSERQSDSVDDSSRIIKAAAKLLLAEIRELSCDRSHYQVAEDSASMESYELPRLLKSLLTSLIASPEKSNFLGQAVIQATRPRSFIAPQLLNLAVELDHLYGSKFLLTHLWRLGVCSSYEEVTTYKQSLIASQDPGSVHTVTCSDDSAVVLTQWIADNVDHNTRTLDGKNTTHCMGIVSVSMCSSGKIVMPPRRIARLDRRMKVGDLIENRVVPIESFDGDRKRCLSLVKFKPLNQLIMSTLLPPITNLNVLWHLTSLLKEPNDVHPNWSGYMQSTCIGTHSSKAEIRMLPLVDLKPTDENCVYSTLLFVIDQAAKLNVVDPCVTFDQPLWLKAVEISTCSNLNIVCRLGGFHTVMSFLGSIGHVMEGSGLNELLEEVYGRDTVSHIMSGKAVSRAIRGHFLIQGALLSKLLKRIICVNDCWHESCKCLTVDQLCLIKDLIGKVAADKFDCDSEFFHAGLKQFEDLLKIEMNKLSCASRTAKLWIRYIHYVDTIKLFVIAERTGNWHLHLKAMSDMLNLFVATGHSNYAKCGRLYLQTMQHLPVSHPWLYRMFTEHGFHTVRRSDRYWAGLSTDLIIEQTLMKIIKGRGGLTRGRGMTESVRTIWLNTLPECASAHLAMSTLTGLHQTTQQHADVGASRAKRDNMDMAKFEDWLIINDPFEIRDGRLRSISTGITASDEDNVTCDEAEEVGAAMNNKMNDDFFYNVSCKRADQVKTLSTVKNKTSGTDKSISSDTNSLFHRLLLSVERSSDIPAHFAFEMTTVPSSLFKGNFMRKADKPVLAKLLTKDSPSSVLCENVMNIVDGGALLHRVRWKKNAKYQEVLQQYCTYVSKRYGRAVVIVFDGYTHGPSTKDHEHMRRTNKVKAVSPDVDIEDNKPVLFEQLAFLSNDHNKNKFIQLLMVRLEDSGIKCIQSNGDADIDIVSTAINLASSESRAVAVIADDTDILVLLLYHVKPGMARVFFLSEAKKDKDGGRKPVDIQVVQKQIGSHACNQLLAIHAIGGCDTTSAIFNRGKGKIFTKITKRKWTKPCTDSLQSKDATLKDVTKYGLQLISLIYDGKQEDCLNRMRYNNYCKMSSASSNRPVPHKLPPTERAAIQHILRVHHQAVVWKHLSSNIIDPKVWGWKLSDNRLEPIMSDQPIAPDDILNVVRCSCKSGCTSTLCSCRKNGLTCVSACSNCHGENCSNSDKALSQNDTPHPGGSHLFDMEDLVYDWDLDYLDEEVVDCMEFPNF